MKKIISFTLAAITSLSLLTTASAVTTMYAPDGRTAKIEDYEVHAWKRVGWYDYPVATVYAPDGRSQVISKSAVSAWKRVGWYDYPVIAVYAPDGRSQVISKDALYSWKRVGWYDYPVTTVYAPDGRTAVISKDAVSAWKKVGWSTTPQSSKLTANQAQERLKNWIGDLGTWVTDRSNILSYNGLYKCNGKEYYQFSLRGWVYDHYSTLTFYVISADGTEIFEGQCSSGYLNKF